MAWALFVHGEGGHKAWLLAAGGVAMFLGAFCIRSAIVACPPEVRIARVVGLTVDNWFQKNPTSVTVQVTGSRFAHDPRRANHAND